MKTSKFLPSHPRSGGKDPPRKDIWKKSADLDVQQLRNLCFYLRTDPIGIEPAGNARYRFKTIIHAWL